MTKFAIIEQNPAAITAVKASIGKQYPFAGFDCFSDVGDIAEKKNYSALIVDEATYKELLSDPKSKNCFSTLEAGALPVYTGRTVTFYFKLPLANDPSSIVKKVPGMMNDQKLSMVIDLYLSELLTKQGLKCNLAGYEYLKDAISMCYFDHTILRKGITKKLYPAIGEKYGVRPECVERAIRHLICSGFDEYVKTPQASPRELFAGRKCPTNSEFIASSVEKLSLYLRVYMYEDR